MRKGALMIQSMSIVSSMYIVESQVSLSHGKSRCIVAEEAPRIFPNQLRFFPSAGCPTLGKEALFEKSGRLGGDFMKTGLERLGDGIGIVDRF